MIQTSDLTRFYGALAAVRDLNLSVEKGELFGFLGPNGAGKTTTIRMIIGLLHPTSGTVRVAGHDVSQEPMAVKRSVGYLPQTPLLYERLTGREFLRFIGGLYGISEKKIESRTKHLMELMALSDKADQLIESYSGGMRNKIGLCAALLHQPPVLVLDEPLTGLDPHSARQVKDLLRDMCRRGHTVFLSTHVLEIAERVCDRVGILDQGQLIAVGTMEDLRAQARSNGDTTLEDLFLELTGGEKETDLVNMLALEERI
jgi:ABC-2 type transport system ATP-binding protein